MKKTKYTLHRLRKQMQDFRKNLPNCRGHPTNRFGGISVRVRGKFEIIRSQNKNFLEQNVILNFRNR